MRQRLRRLRDTVRILPWLLMARLAPPAQRDLLDNLPDDLNDKKLLVVQWNAIGDALMTTPLLSRLKRQFPRARIDVLATGVNRPIFDRRADVDSAYAFRARGSSYNFALWRRLRRNRYDVVIDASAVVRSACLTRSLGGASIGFARRIDTGFLRVDLTPYYNLTCPYSEHRNIPALIESLAETWDTAVFGEVSFDVPVAAIDRAREWYEENRIDGERAIILHPGAKWIPKRWPEAHWIELSLLLQDRWTPILVGSGDDAALIRRIAVSAGPAVKELVGWDIPTLGGIVRESSAAVCNDSFIMHLASALRKPVVALFGPVAPRRVVPRRARIEVLYRDPFCSPCELYYTAERCWRGMNFCLQDIEPKEVLRTLERLLQESKA